jgi:hypothetical protein
MNLKQIGYPALCAMSETQGKRKLSELKVIHTPSKVCWKCNSSMKKFKLKAGGGKGYICKARACRTRISDACATIAHTPLYHQLKGGCLEHTMLLKAMYVVGCKLPVDAGQHMMGVGRDSAKNWFGMIKNALAYAEFKTGEDAAFPPGTLEFDATKTVIDKSSSATTNTHCGRFLIGYHRESGKYALLPLKSKKVAKGAPPPPEEIQEVRSFIRRKTGSMHIMSTDGAQAFKAVGKELKKDKNVTCAVVVHRKKQFAKVIKIPLKSLSAPLRKMAKKLPTTTSRIFRFKSGSNMAECMFGVIKRNLARLNLKRNTVNASMNFLSSAWLHKNPGIEGVAKGMAIYQENISKSISPTLAYKSTEWLRTLERL